MFTYHSFEKKDLHIQQDVVAIVKKKDLKILMYYEIGNNILFISYMLDAQEEQYSENNLHIQQDVVSIIKGI